MFVVRLMVEQVEAGYVFPLGWLADSARGDDAYMYQPSFHEV